MIDPPKMAISSSLLTGLDVRFNQVLPDENDDRIWLVFTPAMPICK